MELDGKRNVGLLRNSPDASFLKLRFPAGFINFLEYVLESLHRRRQMRFRYPKVNNRKMKQHNGIKRDQKNGMNIKMEQKTNRFITCNKSII